VRRWNSYVISAAVLLFSISGFAQAPASQDQGDAEHQGAGMHNRRMDPEQQLERMSKQLNLTDDQKAKVKPILEQQHEQMQSLRQDTSLSQQDRRAKFQEIHQNAMSQIRPLLNENQQKKFDKMLQRQEERRSQRRGPEGPEGGPTHAPGAENNQPQ